MPDECTASFWSGLVFLLCVLPLLSLGPLSLYHGISMLCCESFDFSPILSSHLAPQAFSPVSTSLSPEVYFLSIRYVCTRSSLNWLVVGSLFFTSFLCPSFPFPLCRVAGEFLSSPQPVLLSSPVISFYSRLSLYYLFFFRSSTISQFHPICSPTAPCCFFSSCFWTAVRIRHSHR